MDYERTVFMSVPTASFETSQERRWTISHPRLRLKPTYGSAGAVQGGWWPRADRLHIELPLLLAALSSRPGTIERVIYDESAWAPASLRIEFRGHSVILEPGGSANTLTVSGKKFGTLVLLVVPPDTDPAAARAAVMAAADPDNASTAEDLLRAAEPPRQWRRRGSTGQHGAHSSGRSHRGGRSTADLQARAHK